MDYQKLAELLFPNITETAEEVEARYPKRDLPEGAKVTRIAPSPTGFMHLGNLFGAITDERLAHQSGGVFFLRIEDTDAKRAVEGGVETIINVFKKFGLNFDEGALIDGENGDYGPYRQRQRAHLYHVFAKKLVAEGKAYPCFCTEEDLAKMREQQEAEKVNPGYYGKWAAHRDMPLEEVEKALAEGKAWVLRFRSEGDAEKYLHLNDLVKGKIDMPENDQDIVLLKSDGIPTYHFAHVVDDHLMQTTHVVRGEEWLATWPIHVQLFSALGWKMPKYVHTAQLIDQLLELGEVHRNIAIHIHIVIMLQRLIQQFHTTGLIGTVQLIAAVAGNLHQRVPHKGGHGDGLGGSVHSHQNHGVGTGTTLTGSAILADQQDVDNITLRRIRHHGFGSGRRRHTAGWIRGIHRRIGVLDGRLCLLGRLQNIANRRQALIRCQGLAVTGLQVIRFLPGQLGLIGHKIDLAKLAVNKSFHRLMGTGAQQ